MSYLSTFEGTISTDLDEERNEFETLRTSRKFDCPFSPQEFAEAFSFDGSEIHVHACEWRWYGFDKDMELLAGHLAEAGGNPEGEMLVRGEEYGDIYKLAISPDGTINRRQGRIVFD